MLRERAIARLLNARHTDLAYRLTAALDDAVVIDFPEARQATSFTCGVAAVQAVLYYYGIEKNESQLAAALSVSKKYGTDESEIIKYFRKSGLDVVEHINMTLQEVMRFVEQGIPVIMLIQAWGDAGADYQYDDEDGHYVVAIGYNSAAVIFEDPSMISNKGYLTFAELEKRWHGVSGPHFGMAVIGRPKFDREKLLHIA
jgi:predicted double-glycine peptidase